MAGEIELLDAVEQALEVFGRPRKNPGKARPIAVLIDGTEIRPGMKITPSQLPRIHHLSLPGAFQVAKIATKSTPRTTRRAKQAFCEKLTGRNGFQPEELDYEIERIDQFVPDSRELRRTLKATIKKLRKQTSRTSKGP